MGDNIKEQGNRHCTKFKMYDMVGIRESFPHAFSVLGNKLYFSTLFDNILYEMNLDDGRIEEYFFPSSCNRSHCYRFSVIYDDTVWFIPEYEEFFVLLQGGKISTIPSRGHYASGCIMEEELFLLDRGRFCIDVVDLRAREYKSAISLPAGKDSDYYINIFLGNDCLYVTCGTDCRLLRIDSISRQCEWIKTDALICYGIMVDGEIVYTSTKNDLDGIYAFNINDGKSRRIVAIEYENKNVIQYYRFWNTTRLGKYIYFLPHEESTIIRYDVIKKVVKYFSPVGNNYRTLRPDGSNSIYGITCFKNKVLLIPYYGNQIVALDYDGNFIDSYHFLISNEKIRTLMKREMKSKTNGILHEGLWSLRNYIGFISCECQSISRIDNRSRIGGEIYERIYYLPSGNI